MTVLATVVVATFLLEDDNFIAFYEGTFYLAYYFCPFYGGRAYLDGTVGVNEEDLVKLYGLALFLLVAEIVDIQEFACFGLELLSLNFYDSVHFFVANLWLTRAAAWLLASLFYEPIRNANAKLLLYFLFANTISQFFSSPYTDVLFAAAIGYDVGGGYK